MWLIRFDFTWEQLLPQLMDDTLVSSERQRVQTQVPEV